MPISTKVNLILPSSHRNYVLDIRMHESSINFIECVHLNTIISIGKYNKSATFCCVWVFRMVQSFLVHTNFTVFEELKTFEIN